MQPAYQALGPDHPPLRVHLGLQEKAQLAVVDRMAQLGLDVESLFGLLAHGIFEDLGASAPRILGPLHCGFGPAKHLHAGINTIDGEQGHSDTAGQRDMGALLDRYLL